MKHPGKIIPWIFTLILMQPAAAQTGNTDINELCKDHSIEVIKTIYEQVTPDMTQDQIKAALSIANRSCHEHFDVIPVSEQAVKSGPNLPSEQEEETGTTGNDWFTEYVLKGNPHEKEGVKRLKNRAR